MDVVYVALAKWLVRNTEGTADDYEIYKYGIQIGFEQGLFILSCIVIGVMIQALEIVFLFLVVFYLIRSYIGGLHFKKFGYCYSLSILVAILIVTTAQIPVADEHLLILFSVVGGLIISSYVYLIVTVDRTEIKAYLFYKKKLKVNLIIVGILASVLYVLEFKQGLLVVMNTLVIVVASALMDILMKKVTIKQRN